jgi:anti-anti-sigma regulatory factor
MKARPKKPSARRTAASKPAASRRAAVSRKPKVSAKPARRAAAAAAAAAVTALGADCTIEHAPGLHLQLAKVLAHRACVTLDFSAVKRCDTAGLQVLVAFIRERREAGRELELASLSESFLATVQLLGLRAVFEAGAAPVRPA